MPSFAELDQITQNPEPNYPEYDEVRAAARTEFESFVSPQELEQHTDAVRRRDSDWCAAVLGKPVPNPFKVVVLESRMLIVADQRNLTPPLPERMQRWQAEDAQRQAAVEQRQNQRAEAQRQRWKQTLEQCAVPVEVRPNARGGRTTWRHDGPLRHVVALVDARSDRRRHPAGRALCETPNRAKPLLLGNPIEAPATCQRCLTHARALTDDTQNERSAS